MKILLILLLFCCVDVIVRTLIIKHPLFKLHLAPVEAAEAEDEERRPREGGWKVNRSTKGVYLEPNTLRYSELL